MITQNWNLDFSRGICSRGHDFAYIDMEPTASGAVRCIGPFFQSGFCAESARRLIQQLEAEISEGYVVLGGYAHVPQFREHSFPIYGSECGFIPFLSSCLVLVSNLVFSASCDL